ncbi:hypothetical protein B566_EDAN002911 [Ephemera danica]|nr:hypothetical protein B566_EDAN002911 [Ephemera danica]
MPIPTISGNRMGKEVVALDCDMVGTGYGGKISVVARVSVVDKDGQVLYNTFVRPRDNVQIKDYRTKFNGITPQDLVNATPFEEAQNRVKSLLQGCVLVGHDFRKDLNLLYQPFQRYAKGYRPEALPSLRILSEKVLGQSLEQGEQKSSVEDARTAMKIYMLHRTEWERRLGNTFEYKGNTEAA